MSYQQPLKCGKNFCYFALKKEKKLLIPDKLTGYLHSYFRLCDNDRKITLNCLNRRKDYGKNRNAWGENP
ncbi:hypothetical protein [Avibacterium avium]|uniref:hypothetical protein n=1 Tax=Avibacterium avium TaxID=751 RepID=UPI003BF834B5